MARVTDPGYHSGRIPANKGKTYPAEILPSDEVRALAAQCSTTSSLGIRHRALIVLLYRTGLRISEALALRPKDLNLEIGAIAGCQLPDVMRDADGEVRKPSTW